MSKVDISTSSPAAYTGGQAPKQRMLFACVEHATKACEHALPVEVPLTERTVWEAARDADWIVSAVTAPGQGDDVPVDMVLVCGPCASVVVPPELLAAAHEAMKGS